MPTTTTPESPVTTTTPPSGATVTSTGAGVRDRGNIWIATVTVTVVEADSGAYLPQSVVTGVWSGGGGGNASCITQSDGTCPITLSGLDRRTTSSVTFTVVSVAGPGISVAQLPPPITVTAP